MLHIGGTARAFGATDVADSTAAKTATHLEFGHIFEHLPWALAITLALLVLTGVWLWSLRQQVQHRTRQFRASEERYRLLVENAGEGVVVATEQRFVFANQKAADITGYTIEELTALNFVDEIHPGDRKHFLFRLQRKIRDGRGDTQHQFRIFTKTGELRWILAHSVKIEWDGQPAVLGLFTDISSQKQTEDALRASEERYRTLVENQSDLVVEIDAEGRFTFVSQSYCDAFGKTIDELIGNTFMPLVHEDDRENTARAMEKLVEPPYTAYMEQRALTKDGWCWFAWSDKAIVDDRGQIISVIGVGRDISRRKLAEHALKERDALLQATFESTTDGILIINENGGIIDSNSRFARMWHLTPELIATSQDQKLIDIVAEQLTDPDGFKTRIAALYKNPEPNLDHLYFRDGRVFERYYCPLMVNDAYRGSVWSFRDITERERAARTETTIYQISRAASQTQQLEHLFASIHEIVGGLIDARNFYIALYDPQTEMLSFPYYVDEHDPPPEPRKLGNGLTEYVLKTGKPLLLRPDISQSLKQNESVQRFGFPARDWLGVPLQTKDRMIGVLAVQSYTREYGFGEREQEILSFVSTQIAMAIERVQAEDALRKSERRYRLMFKRSPVGILHYDENLIITEFNDRFVDILRSSRQLLQNLDMKTLKDQRVLDSLRSPLSGQEGFYEGPYMTTTSNQQIYVSIYTAPFYDARGERQGGIAIVLDITERMKAEQAHRESENKFRTLTETAASGIFIIQGEYFKYINQAGEKICGRTMAELRHLQFWEVVHPDDREMAQHRGLARQRGENVPSRYEFRLITPDRGTRWIDFTAAFIEFGGESALLGTAFDITDRKLAEEALATETERLLVTLRSIGDGVITTDVAGYIVLINKIAEDLTGWSQAEAEAHPLADVFRIIDSESRLPIANPIAQVLDSDMIVSPTMQHILISRTGTERIIANNIAPIRDRHGQVIGGVLVFRDITEMQEMEQARKRFINAISHELRTPLTPILGYAEMLLTVDLDAEQQKTLLKQIIRSVGREEKLIDELLAIARLESGTERYHFQEINAFALFEEMTSNCHMLVKQMIRDRYDTDDFHFEFAISPELKTVRLQADSGRVQQVVENLLINAIKFSNPSDLWIELKAELRDKNIQVAVCDHGRGIPLHEKEKIFKAFYQIRRGSDDVSDGIGQGLVIVRRYVEAHGGTVQVESDVGQGSCFIFTLPVSSHTDSPLTSRSLLLVEDDETTSNFITLLMRKQGYAVTLAKNGAEALQYLTELAPDLMVLDLQLPDILGEQVLEKLTRLGYDIPVLICSAQPEEKIVQVMGDFALVRDYIIKPFPPRDILSKVEDILSNSRHY